MEQIIKHFPNLSNIQLKQYENLERLYVDWNRKVNVISRKDISNIITHHILHSLVIAKYCKFVPKTKILDLGTGGGLPGIPLAIFFSKVSIVGMDGTLKKIKVVNNILQSLEISNMIGQHKRAEETKQQFEFVVTRAVAKVDKLLEYTSRCITIDIQRNSIPNGIIALKGGDPKEEINLLSKKAYYEITPITTLIDEEHFDNKYIMYIQR